MALPSLKDDPGLCLKRRSGCQLHTSEVALSAVTQQVARRDCGGTERLERLPTEIIGGTGQAHGMAESDSDVEAKSGRPSFCRQLCFSRKAPRNRNAASSLYNDPPGFFFIPEIPFPSMPLTDTCHIKGTVSRDTQFDSHPVSASHCL